MYCNNCVSPKNLRTSSTVKRLELNCDFQRHVNGRLTPSHRQHRTLVGIVNVDVFLQGSQVAFCLQPCLENGEHLKYFRNVDCLATNHSKASSSHANKPQNYKLITVAVSV